MIIKVFKKIIFSVVLLYSFNLIAIKFGVILPINYITIGLVSLMDIPAMILLTFSLILVF
ncbi:MAG: pro-sigmaK processing inhibitor BofA family protein [Bacilli bacterium]|nr:pro-sigmaK processing inhibitor BofA family protein [Bacilli bacterium]